ncbi:hypothetical protein BVRB_9g210490 [Beta vulgaris subsp. vulgaris]|nr:hypothetical protein BVRB_9g210490 [Beta vulgaris subsp. vulgaris]
MASTSEESVASNSDLEILTFRNYIYQVLKVVHEDLEITREAVIMMDDLINGILENLSMEATRLVERDKQPYVTSREIQTAARILFPGDLGRHAVAEGLKAVLKFSCS